VALVFVGIGSNRERERHIAQALNALAKQFGKVQVSPVYASASVPAGGADYFNLVAGFDCDRSPGEIVATLKAIEHDVGRRRGGAACAIDLDLLVVGDTVLEENTFELPRPDILEHAFVLRPLADLAPTIRHPIAGQSYAALWQAMAPRAQRLVRVPWPPRSA
jgi:2-amino-4-hydroxy-6-hydroxymethyldihydropteridine diphosphokinase